MSLKMFYTKSHFEDSRGKTYGSPIESDLFENVLHKITLEDSQGETYGSPIESDVFENVLHKITLWGLTRWDMESQ